ncbi:MAG TPA: hypothetical protein VF116_09110 [Ktedonobacterales bacterium]
MPRRERAGRDTRHAITDLYDVQRGTFLIHYPVLLIVLLCLFGVVAFSLSGFFGTDWPGRTVTPVALDPAFAQPWPLYLWFCALMITLLASIFRDAALRRRLIAVLVVAALAIAIVGAIRFSQSLPQWLQDLIDQHRLLTYLSTHSITYLVINFGLIAIFWLDTFRRWARRARGLPPSPRVTIGTEPEHEKQDLPDMQELVSGDLIAGAVLALLLSLLFRTEIVASLIHTTPPVNACLVSLTLGCPIAAGAHVPPTITFVDVIQALVYLPLGLMVLALSATLSGLGAIGGVNEHDGELPAARLAAQGALPHSGTTPIAEDVAATIVDTLKAALDRRIRSLGRSLALSLRLVGWPSLLFLAAFGLTDLAIGIQGYLHSGKHLGDVVAYVLPAAIWGLVALLTMVCSAALMLFKWRVVDNTLRFLGLIGFIVLITFWIFSLALWGFNKLIEATATDFQRTPFDPLSFSTAISFAALVAAAGYFALRGRRERKAVAQTAGAVPVPAAEPTPPQQQS